MGNLIDVKTTFPDAIKGEIPNYEEIKIKLLSDILVELQKLNAKP